MDFLCWPGEDKREEGKTDMEALHGVSHW